MSDLALRADPARGRWIPWVFVGGMLLVVAVNLVLVWFALSTFTGVTVGHAYDRGRTYNHVIEEATRQEALGWQAVMSLEAGRLTIRVTDRGGNPVHGAVAGRLERPLDGTALPLAFTAIGRGHFAASAEGGHLGQWDARLQFISDSGERFEIRKRMVVR